MFGWFKKNLITEMNTFYNFANITTNFALFQHNCTRSGIDIKSEHNEKYEFQILRTAAMVNFLFGKPTQEMHIKQLNLDSEKNAALEWLRKNLIFRELVVQSLRVKNTTDFGSGKIDGSITGEEILTAFGSEYPIAPNPKYYEALVDKAFLSLSPDMQQLTLQLAKRLGINF